MARATPVTIEVGERTGRVSGLYLRPRGARALYAFAHGAGAGMTHRFMEAAAEALAAEGIATLRYQFPYTERGERRPSPRPQLLATVRAAVAEARRRARGVPVLAGGKSMGGRMTSLAASEAPLEGVSGLVFYGFPLHAAGKPGAERGAHLAGVGLPMLFLQGTKDRLADLHLLEPLVKTLPDARLHAIPDADHSFHVPKRSGRTDDEILADLATQTATFTNEIRGRS